MTQNTPPPEAPEDEAPSDHPVDHPLDRIDTLKQAMRRARSDDAERTGARAELRAARLLRLEMLQDALQHLVAQIPADVDLFDVALVPTADPRLFIDMIGFVAMGRDARRYILQQDTRHGRVVVAESESLDTMIDAVTDYVARRLLERDKALAADARARAAPPQSPPAQGLPSWPGSEPDRLGEPRRDAPRQDPEPVRRAPVLLRWSGIAFAFLIDLLGAVAFFGIVGALCWYLWARTHPPT